MFFDANNCSTIVHLFHIHRQPGITLFNITQKNVDDRSKRDVWILSWNMLFRCCLLFEMRETYKWKCLKLLSFKRELTNFRVRYLRHWLMIHFRVLSQISIGKSSYTQLSLGIAKKDVMIHSEIVRKSYRREHYHI